MVPHPVPAHRAEGRTGHRLTPTRSDHGPCRLSPGYCNGPALTKSFELNGY
ncbi:hypothetical protein [Streptomyces violaceusniger]|uniref:Uncharacterized protein n=1 Tax=Streptomyces violaceusniger (strain Tu 4113) TaxID=653045 RepID=G2PFA7_STRV4|nr:hypothetical protein [Streptomyces violaceusniger]AEM84250.1 hypothetical protein Strvi_4665 [Streptomyces violaceusniger Tu 4113]